MADISRQEPSGTDPRIALALSILQHRAFCYPCSRHADEIIMALRGLTVEDLLRERLNGGAA